MEECSDNNNVNLAMTDSSNLVYKANFDRKLVEYDEQNQDSQQLLPQYAFYLENSVLISC
ncbi:unnamed protein product [Acanthoscelides obtectus]|uniref:Uncharacterized protein n=1 Tax=Acanthoscelides obtectus TaxID=200917 RepID=A0A9P0KBX6_ACAOB|nr:unnamed protein product [Acanthoscelides obtectus]CAK1640959.1 hypothetical protein AOBTE_LOCUS12041 [Acanthoscelides obtectus]